VRRDDTISTSGNASGEAMPEKLDAPADSSSDQERNHEIALFYANGDSALAEKILSGAAKDVYVIRGEFNSMTSLCGFICYFHYYSLNLNSVHSVFSNSPALKDLKPDSDWRRFEKQLVDLAGGGENDAVLSSQFNNAFAKAFTHNLSVDFKKLIDAKDEIAINHFFQQLTQDRTGFQGTDMRVGCEFISSLDMELYSLTSRKMIENKECQEGDKACEPDIQLETEEDDAFIGDKDVKLILQGSLILSPVTGRDVGLLIVGDRIKLKIVDTNPRAVQVAKAFNAYDESGYRPMTGRIVSIKRRADGGFKIHVIIAKGIYVKIDETEQNIKIAVDASFVSEKTRADGISRLSFVIIAVLSAVIIAMFAVLILLFK
jgi:hypothetical protein